MTKIKIEDIYAEFDTKTGFINLTSRDKRLKKKPFKVAVTGTSSTYETLLNLIESEIDIEKIELPERSPSVGVEKLVSEEKDTRTSIIVGENIDGLETWDLTSCNNTLIYGGVGSGITFVTSSILAHADSQENIKLYAADCKGVEIQENKYTSKNTNIAKGKSNIIALMDQVIELIDTRYKFMEEMDLHNFLNVEMAKSVFFVIDSLDKLKLSESELEDFIGKMNKVLILGRAAGVFLFISVNRINNIYLDRLHKNNIGRRVTSCDSADFISLNNTRPNWSGAYTQGMGRCIVNTYNEQKLVQLYHVKS